jgi:hypothetical protein
MSKRNWYILISVIVLLSANLACAFSDLSAPAAPDDKVVESLKATEQAINKGFVQLTQLAQPGVPGAAPAAQPLAVQTALPAAAPTPKAAVPAEASSLPIGLSQGLASLNSYRFKIEINMTGPTSKDKTLVLNQVDYDKNSDSTHTHNENIDSTVEDPSDERSVSDSYVIGSKKCDLSGTSKEDVTTTQENKQKTEMNDTMGDLLDIGIHVEKPVFAGAETVNGVATNHFKFTVGGLGKKSGAQTTQSSGEYWVAQDGQYLVKYSAVMETRSAPQGNPKAEVVSSQIQINLSDINQPIKITFPSLCN